MQSNTTRQLLLAAERGDAAAQFNLAVIYDNEFDDSETVVADNRVQALRWLLAAAEQGFPRAQGRLAQIYAGGPASPKNYVSACAWFLLAIASLDGIHRHQAQSGYERVRALLTPAQLTKARGIAAGWKPKKGDEIRRPAS